MAHSALALACATGLAGLGVAAAAHAVPASWLGGAGIWNDPTKWSSNPLYPCNGNGGQSFDVSIPSGTVTLNLDCDVDAFTFTSGTLDGDFDLTAHGLLTWSGGTLAGNGTTQASGGLALTSGGNKLFANGRSLEISGGTASWSGGNIILGAGGATLRNQVSLTATGGTGRTLSDTGDSGSFFNEGTFTLALDSATNVLTLSPGTFTQSGALHVNTGVLSLDATGSHTGSFDGAGTLRFSGGAQQLAAGSSTTAADLEVTGGTLGVQAGASFAVGNVDLQTGTLSIADAGTTATAGTASLLSGTLTGAGTFETSGLLTWSAGTMSGSGTTRALGGVVLSGSGNKGFGSTRTLDIATGAASWSGGSITLGAGGATLRNQGSLTATGGTGHTLVDTGDTGTFLNEGIFTLALDSPSAVLTLSPGTLAQSGAVHVNSGVLVLDATGSYTGSFDGAGTLRFSGGAQQLAAGSSTTAADLEVTGGTLSVQAGASFAVGNVDLQTGTLSIADAGTTATAGTATFLSGTLGGAGTFESSGLLTWSGGTMSGSGTTRALGGLVLSGSGLKNFADTRTLQIASAATWSGGSISLGAGGATLRNQSSLTASGATG
ncbi:MAG TPA: hypothetical protein VFY49_20095, partial [Myxococcota bacterium]|nr:hypothetical protein [Myxococcota bacterium]